MDAQIKMAKFHLLLPKKTRNTQEQLLLAFANSPSSGLLRLFFRQNKAKFISFLFARHLCKGLFKYRWLVTIMLFSVPFSAFAEAAAPVLSKGLEPSDHIWQIMTSLTLILLLIFVGAWLVKRFGRVNGVASDKMQVLANMAVGQRERIILLEIGGEQLLIGVTPSQVNFLYELKEPIDFNKQQNSAVGLSQKISQNFAEKLQDAMQSRKESKSNNTLDKKKELSGD